MECFFFGDSHRVGGGVQCGPFWRGLEIVAHCSPFLDCQVGCSATCNLLNSISQ